MTNKKNNNTTGKALTKDELKARLTAEGIVKEKPEGKKPTTEKKSSKKSAAEKQTAKKPATKTEKPVEKKQTGKKNLLDKVFPAKFSNEEGDFELLSKVKGFDDLSKAFDALGDEESLVLAAYWPEAFEEDYEEQYSVDWPIEGFTNDLDLLSVSFFLPITGRMVAVSSVTEAVYVFTEDDFEVGAKGKFVTKDMPFAVYRMK